MKIWSFIGLVILPVLGCNSSETKKEGKSDSVSELKKLPEENNKSITNLKSTQEKIDSLGNNNEEIREWPKNARDTITIGKKYVLQVINIIKDSSSFKNATGGKSINAGFPYGSKILVTYKFPSGWEFPHEKPNVPNPNGDLLDKVRDYYQKVANSKVVITPPKISKLAYLQLPYSWHLELYTSILNTHNNYKLRLPNIGPYECYYFSDNPFNNYKYKGEESVVIFTGVGNLVFVDPKTREAKVLNVYLEREADYSWISRFFYIKPDGQILIYEFGGFEIDTMTLNYYTVNVSKTGEITFIRTQ
ncbi:hypothetical protein [Adhaeribacter soli]|uniref:Uncharacterized protein n=1 Tax=Adhaeribacter soli TaxID=2607655 RepID=A0A5N1J1F2_9BACT|nr:hypothetical protein [Adhaeribacter soli]KAA9340254.1 hypothetical protein F0P94_07870 [Adhaeribacter soli]